MTFVRYGRRWRGVLPVALLVLGFQPGAARAEDAAEAPGEASEKFDRAMSEQQDINQESLSSQDRIEQLSDETEDLLTRYRAALRQTESLETYTSQMRELLASQSEEREALRAQLDQIDLVGRDITPLMLRMIDALDQFVSLDVPFLIEERTERISDLRKTMRRADVTEAEKFRNIMEAYQIESEYGRTIEAYRSTLDRSGRELTVDFLRVGRIALVYQTLDEAEAGAWNPETNVWELLDASYASAIRQGLRIARKQSAPDLIQVPLPRPEVTEGTL